VVLFPDAPVQPTMELVWRYYPGYMPRWQATEKTISSFDYQRAEVAFSSLALQGGVMVAF
jgi:hypothetical protein